MENLAHLVFWQNKIFQTGTSLISTTLKTKNTAAFCKSKLMDWMMLPNFKFQNGRKTRKCHFLHKVWPTDNPWQILTDSLQIMGTRLVSINFQITLRADLPPAMVITVQMTDYYGHK